MATYDIDKITLPNGDVCNLYATNADEYENLVVNGGPVVEEHIGSQHYSPTNWGCYTGSPSLMSTWYMNYREFTFPVTTPSSGSYFQLQKVITRSTNRPTFAGGINIYALHDGDKVTISFDYISPFILNYQPRLFVKATSDSETYNCFMTNSDEPISLPVTSDWVRVSYTGTVQDGWDNAVQSIMAQGYGEQGFLVFNFYPQGTGDMKIRNVKINKGEIATKYSDNPLDTLFKMGSASSYIASREAAIIKNNGNYTGTGDTSIYPIIGGKSQTGFWTSGTAGDKYQFVYLTDANYAARNNYAEVFSLPLPESTASATRKYNILTTKTTTEQLDIPLQTSSSTSSTGPGLSFYDEDGSLGGRIYTTTSAQNGTQRIRRLRIAQYSMNTGSTRSSYVERYTLPDVTWDRTADAEFSILTTKDSVSQIYNFGVDTSSNKTITLPTGASRGLIVSGGTNADTRGMHYFNCASDGSITWTTFFSCTKLTLTSPTTRQLRFANTSTSFANVTIFFAQGTVSSIS